MTAFGAAFEHQRRHGVPEEVARTALAELGTPDVLPHHVGEVVRGEGLAVLAEEEHSPIR